MTDPRDLEGRPSAQRRETAETIDPDRSNGATGETVAKATHSCHAINCGKPTPPRMLMCGWHWRLVPAPLKAAVWAAYREGQEIRKDPSEEWHRAADAAIQAVARIEGATSKNKPPRTLKSKKVRQAITGNLFGER